MRSQRDDDASVIERRGHEYIQQTNKPGNCAIVHGNRARFQGQRELRIATHREGKESVSVCICLSRRHVLSSGYLNSSRRRTFRPLVHSLSNLCAVSLTPPCFALPYRKQVEWANKAVWKACGQNDPIATFVLVPADLLPSLPQPSVAQSSCTVSGQCL